MKNTEYDVLVIGAGPGGSVLARNVARLGYSVLLIEKRPVIGAPVRCGEATTGLADLNKHYGPIHEDCIETVINGMYMVGPGGMTIRATMPEIGVMLDRLKFDPWLAKLAADAGAEVVVNARAKDIGPVQNGMRAVPVVIDGAEVLVRARMVVGADGIEALSGRWVGIDTRQLPPKTCSAIELKVEGILTDPDYLTFWQGHDFINDGYIWSFPKVKSNTTNFGAGFLTPKLGSENIYEVTKKWLAKLYPDAKVLDVVGGVVPVSGNLSDVTRERFFMVGDAAHHCNPLTGGGIAAAMRAGQLGAKAIGEAFEAGDFSHEFLKRYERSVYESFGKTHEMQLKARRFVLSRSPAEQAQLYDVFKVFFEQGGKWGVLRNSPLKAAKLAYQYMRFA